jgi:diketogulonate reductase-like aldo/keto reductase
MAAPKGHTTDGLSRLVSGRDGLRMPAFGVGTWRMGESARDQDGEVAAIRLAVDEGVRLIDTAEMYGSGKAEEIVAEAVKGRRDEVFIVSKVMPHNASRAGTLKAAEASLKRLATDRIDLYLLHWPGSAPLEETLDAFDRLKSDGKIRHYGISNFDAEEMARALGAKKGAAVSSNQVMYNLARRGIETRLLPWCAKQEVVVMAYSPLDRGRLKAGKGLKAVAERHDVTPEAVAIAWTMRLPHLVTIPKAASPKHLRADLAAARIVLSKDDLALLDRDYPPPKGDVPLDIE